MTEAEIKELEESYKAFEKRKSENINIGLKKNLNELLTAIDVFVENLDEIISAECGHCLCSDCIAEKVCKINNEIQVVYSNLAGYLNDCSSHS